MSTRMVRAVKAEMELLNWTEAQLLHYVCGQRAIFDETTAPGTDFCGWISEKRGLTLQQGTSIVRWAEAKERDESRK